VFLSFLFPFPAKGLPPLPDPSATTTPSGDAKDSQTKKQQHETKEKTSLSFSSGPSHSSRPTGAAKRKAAVGDCHGEESASRGRVGGVASSSSKIKPKKKPKVGLSFADDA
jgi:hypothetical protein